MYYLYYFIRIFREIFGRRKLKQILIIALLLILLCFCFSRLGAFATTDPYGLYGDDTYTDPNNSIFALYDSYLNDLAVRINNSADDDVEDLIWRLSSYSFIVLRGNSNMDMSNDFQHLRVVLFNSSVTFNNSTAYSAWRDMDCNIVYNSSNNGLIYDFTDLDCTRSNLNSTIYCPYMLINRYNTSLVEVLSNKRDTSTTSIVNALNAQTAKIEEGNQILEDTQDYLTDDTITQSNMDIDTTDMTVPDDNGVDNFIISLLTSFKTFFENIGNEVEYITIPIPHNGGQIDLPSNLLSKYIVNTWFEPMISTMWYFAFGTYLLFYIRFIIKFWSTGEFSNSGLAYFIEHLENNDPFINASMM